MRTNSGFTLIEIMIVVIILGIMASIVIPKVVGPNERMKSSEGQNTLIVLLGAQKNRCLESNAYATSMAGLDVTIPTSSYFAAPTPLDPGTCSAAGNVASVASTAGGYTLYISDAGAITCGPSDALCFPIKCNKNGIRQCNS